MSVEVLANSDVNVRARAELRERGLDFATPWLLRALRKTSLVGGLSIGDSKKSWDLLSTVRFLEERVDRSSAILDIGAFASEILCALHKLGYSDLTGIDLNPRLVLMPHAETIRYVVGDFSQTSFSAGSFDVITAISVLEHGFCGRRVLTEVSRLLKPGGYFVGSVDYWPEKIDTSGVTAFGVDWKIFSKEELEGLVEQAGSYGMAPVGRLNFRADKRPINWQKRRYTFAWFSFQKLAGRPEGL